jgi:hypothetical protein
MGQSLITCIGVQVLECQGSVARTADDGAGGVPVVVAVDGAGEGGHVANCGGSIDSGGGGGVGCGGASVRNERGTYVGEEGGGKGGVAQDVGVVESFASATDGASAAYRHHGHQPVVRPNLDGRGCEGFNIGAHDICDEVVYAVGRNYVRDKPSNTPDRAVVFCEYLVYAVRCCLISEVVLYPGPVLAKAARSQFLK